jgi:hypothetical protein
MVRAFRGAALAAVIVCLAGPAHAYGLFTCVDQTGREVCVLDTGTRTGFSPSQLCNTSCPACAGRCDAAKRYPERSGQWTQTWQGTPGISDDNILVPGQNPREDARTIVREGLAAPAPSPQLPPAGRQSNP